MEQLGGHATFLGVNDLQLTRGETLPDTAHIMSGYVDGIAGRFGRQADLEAFASGARVPVYNGLTERFHPIEALSDLLTLRPPIRRSARPAAGLYRRRQQRLQFVAVERGDLRPRCRRGVARGVPA